MSSSHSLRERRKAELINIFREVYGKENGLLIFLELTRLSDCEFKEKCKYTLFVAQGQLDDQKRLNNQYEMQFESSPRMEEEILRKRRRIDYIVHKSIEDWISKLEEEEKNS
jgi:hypothetical protein